MRVVTVFMPKLRRSVVAAVVIFTALAGLIAVATLSGHRLLSDDAFGDAIGLYGCGLIALGGLAMLVLLMRGYPRVEIGNGIATVNGGIWRRTADLSRFGEAYAGYESAGGQEQATIYFYTGEHETALLQTGQFEPPNQLRFDFKLPVGGVVGSDRQRLDDIAQAINAARDQTAASLRLTDGEAQALSQSAMRPRVWAVVTVVVLATLSLGFELLSSADTGVPGMALLLLAICAVTAAITWGVAIRNPLFRPFAALDERLGGQLWIVTLALVLALAGYGWVMGA